MQKIREYDEISFMKSPYAEKYALIRNSDNCGILDIVENRESYIFSSLTASIDGEFHFENAGKENIGNLT